MESLYYSALDLAVLISARELCEKEIAVFLESVWEKEKDYLAPQYKNNRRKLILDTYYWTHYFYNKTTIDAEFPSIQRDMIDFENTVVKDNYTSDFSSLDLFFKNMRIRIVVDGARDYVRIKLRTLLKEYGYKRRSKMLVDYINCCLEFYHLKAFLRGGIECKIEDVDIDEMLTFRIFQ